MVDKAGAMATFPIPPKISIVIATYSRPANLMKCVEAVRKNVITPFELVVVGGASDDGTAEWVAAQSDILFIHELQREGATKAYNRGFRAATAPYVMWLNDDSFPLPGSVEAAVSMIERTDIPDLGMVAFYHNERRAWNRLDEVEHLARNYAIYNVRGFPYANFGLLRRELLANLGYLDERYYFCGWDPDLALKIHAAGLRVLGCRSALIHHDELHDERKMGDLATIDADNAKLFAKWNLPAKLSYPDPAPAYRWTTTALGLR